MVGNTASALARARVMELSFISNHPVCTNLQSQLIWQYHLKIVPGDALIMNNFIKCYPQVHAFFIFCVMKWGIAYGQFATYPSPMVVSRKSISLIIAAFATNTIFTWKKI